MRVPGGARSRVKSAAAAGGVSLVGSVATHVLSAVRIALIARMLAPAEFGRYVIASSVLVAVELTSGSTVKDLLVVRSAYDEQFLDRLWTFQVARGLVTSVALCAVSIPAEAVLGNAAGLLLPCLHFHSFAEWRVSHPLCGSDTSTLFRIQHSRFSLTSQKPSPG